MYNNIKSLASLVFLCLYTFISFSQENKGCNCPEKTITHAGKPDSVYQFSNEKKIGLYGYIDIEDKHIHYSEFVIFFCEEEKKIAEWGALQTCLVEQKKDTLVIGELYDIPNGKNHASQWQPFYISKYYFKSSQLIDTSCYRTDLRKYSAAEIKIVLAQHEALTTKDYEYVLLIGHRLFWAYVSGSKQAGVYLENFRNKFGPFDGAIAEDFSDLIATYMHYKRLSAKKDGK